MLEEGTLLILEYVSQGRLTVDDAVALFEALALEEAPEVWVVPMPAQAAYEVCLN